jgi:hypothetical protein
MKYRIKVNEERGDLEGVKICQNAPSINHLLFADGSLLLLKVDERSANHLQHVLSLYEDCSGQTIWVLGYCGYLAFFHDCPCMVLAFLSFFGFLMATRKWNIMCWNIRGIFFMGTTAGNTTRKSPYIYVLFVD